jgi:LmbE family N-acetylglucosaminyl deacetylase
MPGAAAAGGGELLEQVPATALAVYAHPNDADVACGGTMARWAKEGCEVHLVVCTDGGKGTRAPSTAPGALAKRRAKEVRAAGTLESLASLELWGMEDGALDDGEELRRRLVGIIRRLRPEVALGHDPTAVFFGQDYFNHRDHRAAGWAFLDALSPAAALPHYFPEEGPPHQVATVYLSATLEPDVWVDISAAIDQKVAAVQCHSSQFTDGGRWAAEAVLERAADGGRRAGVPYAEGFRRLRLGA